MSPMVKLPLTMEHALLGFLREQPMHAYEMHQRLKQVEPLGLVWHLKQSQLYALLTRLEGEGYITTHVEPQGSRPPRKTMRLTPSGQRAFGAWLVAPVEHGRDFRMEFLAKLFFARQAEPAAVERLIDAQRSACQRWLDDLRRQAEAVGETSSYEWLVVQFRIGQIDAILSWLDMCRETLLPASVP